MNQGIGKVLCRRFYLSDSTYALFAYIISDTAQEGHKIALDHI
jgi:hypothetical protein